jgi:hypothetical protein
MQRQADRARADEVDRTLTHYAIAIFDVMDKYNAVTPPAQNETEEQARERLNSLSGGK